MRDSVVAAACIVAATTNARTAQTPSEATRSEWQSRVARAISEGEYHLSLRGETGGFSAPNRAHDFRARWSPDGTVALESRTVPGEWSFSYRLVGVGRGASVRARANVLREEVIDGRLDWDRQDLREWYVNDARGIEQGFVLESRPAGDSRDPLIIQGAIEGLLALPAGDGQSVVFRTPAGRDAMRARELSVVDASGTVVAACFEVGAGTLAVVVYDDGAVYPLTVDLLMTSPAWTSEGNQTGASFGYSVATAGDVNGDGYSDVIIGAHEYDNGEIDEGRAYVYLGSLSGPSTIASWTTEGNQLGAMFGWSVATAGDVNRDGYSDVVVGAPFYDNGEISEGGAFVYLGSVSGLGQVAAWTAESDQVGGQFGVSVATAGDLNGDGYADLLVGAKGYDNGQVDEGRAFGYLGSASGLTTTAVWTAESDQATADFGQSVASAGDVNGDGYADVIVGAGSYDNRESDEGRAFVYLGSAPGLASTPAWSAESNQMSAKFGVSVATAGDVNGDGYADIIVGADSYSNGETNEGSAFVYLGSAAGLAASAAWTAESNQPGSRFGMSVATAADVNGDGYADVIVGAPAFDNGEVNEGGVFIYMGSSAGLRFAALTVESNHASAGLGWSANTAGDVNGDGYSDVIAGALSYGNGEIGEGAAFVYMGSASGLAPAESWSAESNQADAKLGLSVATAGDVNGDGYSDVIAGAFTYDNGESGEGRTFLYHGSASGLAMVAAWTAESDLGSAFFGYSVATAGDVNGDGYSDVIVGAPSYSNGESVEGGAFVYHGSSSGLGTTAAWTAESDQVSAQFGSGVATAGDVNGDGYADVIVGAHEYDNGESTEGRTFVYFGAAVGLATSAAWTAESDQTNAQFGLSAATAGDVNGDGYADVIVGAYAYENGERAEGRAFVYLGSAFGLSTTAAWTAEGNVIGAWFGYSVGTAGDVNGDGYADVIVGAPESAVAGRAFVYLGSAAGLVTTAAWTAAGDKPGTRFGLSVATAGDVNGDGYSDVIAGAYWYDNGEADEGGAFLYLGSTAGVATSPAWSAESNQVGAGFGIKVATAGDANGDGYSDVIVGAWQYDNGESDEGRVFLYYGNDGDGLDRIPRQAAASGLAPIDLLGGALSTDGFRLRANGRSPFGRDRVRLEWEVKPVATPFDGAAIQTSSWFDTGAPGPAGSAVSLDELHAPLAGPGPFHWRLRLRSRSAFPWQSHWMSLPYNAITETDLRTENILARCDLAFADLSFPPLAPAKVAPWVYTQTCAGGDVLPTLLWPSIVTGTDVDTLVGSSGTLRVYQLSCGCTDGIYLTKQAGRVRLDLF